jgi:hypothetical protein
LAKDAARSNAHVPEEIGFAAKTEIARELLSAAPDAGRPAPMCSPAPLTAQILA